MKKLKKLKFEDIERLTEIWLQNFSKNIYSLLGKKIIKIYFENCLLNKNLGVVIEVKGKIAGFVLYGKSKKIDSYILKNYFFNILNVFLVNLIKLKIKNLKIFINTFLFLLLIKKNIYLPKNDVELLYIAIEKEHQNKGIGKYLVQNSLIEFSDYFSRYKHLWVKTLGLPLKNVNFYKYLNFKIKKSIFGRVYLNYDLNNKKYLT